MGLREGPKEPAAEPIAPDGRIVRVNLRPYLTEQGDLDRLFRAFIQTAAKRIGSLDVFQRYLTYAEEMAVAGELPFSSNTLQSFFAKKEAESLLSRVEVVNGVNLLSARVSSANQQVLREMADFIRDKLKSAVVVLGAVGEGRPVFLAAVTPDLVERGYNAGEIVKQVARVAGGGGGGKASLAQAGGKYQDKLDEALRRVKDLI